jgi:hypothetical protein
MEPRDCEDGLQPKAEPVPESAYPRIITRRSLLICCLVGYIPIIAAIFLLMPFARRHHPVGTPIALAPVFCFLTYSHAVAAGLWMRRPCRALTCSASGCGAWLDSESGCCSIR